MMRLLVNIGGGGHLKIPCYDCLLERNMRKNPQFLVKESTNHLTFYDFDLCQTVSPRTIESYSNDRKFPEPLKPIIENTDFESVFIPGSLHTLLGTVYFHL